MPTLYAVEPRLTSWTFCWLAGFSNVGLCIFIDGDSKRQFLDGSHLTDFPAFAVESLATYDS